MHDVVDFIFTERGVPGAVPRPDLALPGSPDRCLERAVYQDLRGTLWVLEKVAPSRAEHGERMGRLLALLSGRGLDFIHPWLSLPNGRYLSPGRDCFRRVSPYVSGHEPRRPEYIHSEPMGRNLARCLGELRRAGHDLPEPPESLHPAPPFSVRAYLDEFIRNILRENPEILPRLRPAIRSLEGFVESVDQGPRALCHGDFHPLNVVWRDETPAGLVDWEFAGLKPELYDAALMIGCVGMESPPALIQGLVPAFVSGLREEGLLTPENEPGLLPLVLCVRFAWLAEWLRKRDREMVEMEMDYLDILREDAGRILSAWRRT